MAGPYQFFVHLDAPSADGSDTLVFDTQRTRNRFLCENPGCRKLTVGEYTDICALRLGVHRVANTHFTRCNLVRIGVRHINNWRPMAAG